MIREKWESIVGNILDTFEVEEQDKEHIDEHGGIDIEYIIFKSPLGRVRLEYTEKPVILDRKTTYSSRIGSDTAVEYVYSKDEKSSRLNAYKWSESEEDWIEINANSFS